MTMIQRHLTQLVDRRRAERRQPLAKLKREQLEADLLAILYTGPAIVEYKDGRPAEYNVMGARIVLDKTAPQPDSKSGT